MKNLKINKRKLGIIATALVTVTTLTACFSVTNTMLISTPIVEQTQGKTNAIKINIFGEYINLKDTKPYIEDNRTMVPIRLISESLGFDVKWDEGTKEFAVKGVDVKDREIVIIVGKMGQSEVAVSKKGAITKKNIDSSPKVVVTMKNNRLYVPLRFFSESFNFVVKYDGKTKTIFISFPGEKDPSVSEEVVWNGNVNEFLDDIVDKTDMTIAEGGGQAYLGINGSQLIVSDPKYSPNSKGSKVEITAQGWIIAGRFYPSSVKERNQETMDIFEKVIQMYTSDKTTFSKINKIVQKSGTGEVKTSDGKTIKINDEASGLKIRFY